MNGSQDLAPTGLKMGIWYTSLVYRVHSNLESELLIVSYQDCFPDQEAEHFGYFYDIEDVTQNDALLPVPFA